MAENKVITINEFNNLLKEEINLEIKARVDESLSSKLYHFCSLAAAMSIIKDGRFHLSPIGRNGAETKMATIVDRRKKAVYPYTKTVETVNDLPDTEKCGTIYRVTRGDGKVPDSSCYEFDGDRWNYIEGSNRKNSGVEPYLKKGSVFATKLNNGKVSYTDDSKRYKGQYYMCFSRVPGAFDGYSARMALEKWKGVYVRFSCNGDILNYKYKGEPVNFYTDGSKLDDHLRDIDINAAGVGNKPLMVRKPMKTNTSLGTKFANEIDRIKVYEHEDRLFSNEPDIPSKNAKDKDGNLKNETLFSTGIVERIDIFVSSSVLKKENDFTIDILNKIGDIIKRCKQYGILKLVHIYDKEKGLSAFPLQQLLQKVTPDRRSKLMNKFKDYIELNRPLFQEKFGKFFNAEIAKTIKNSEAGFIAELLGILNYGHFSDDESYKKNIEKMIKEYGLSKFRDEIVSRLRPLEYYQNEVGQNYFGMEMNIIYSRINELQGWKIQEIGDKLRKMISDYIKKNDLKTTINTFKKHQWKINHGIEIIDRRRKEHRAPRQPKPKKKQQEPTLFSDQEINEMVEACMKRLLG